MVTCLAHTALRKSLRCCDNGAPGGARAYSCVKATLHPADAAACDRFLLAGPIWCGPTGSLALAVVAVRRQGRSHLGVPKDGTAPDGDT